MTRLLITDQFTAPPPISRDPAVLTRAKGFTTFLGDVLRLTLTWTMPYIAFRTAETVTAAVAPEMVPEIAGGTAILSLGVLVYMVIVTLRKPIKRVLRWIANEEVTFATYLAD
jgi:hypothetical protein